MPGIWTTSFRDGARSNAAPLGVRSTAATLLLAALCLFPADARAQATKDINQQTQFWWSVNSTTRITDRFGAIGDFHIRRNDFIRDPSFYFVRAGASAWITERLTAVLGYAHMWNAPAQEGWETWSNENRIYQQLQYATKIGTIGVVHRFRNEQRWKEVVANDTATGATEFSNRVRYLLSFTIPVSPDPKIPALVLSDEILVQFGSDIVLNTFDQNRLFLGMKQRLTPIWSFDLGYMLVYQQKAAGYEYDLNHTIRWFFYCIPDLRGLLPTHAPAGSEE